MLHYAVDFLTMRLRGALIFIIPPLYRALLSGCILESEVAIRLLSLFILINQWLRAS